MDGDVDILSFQKETFLEATVENFSDYIKNMVYIFQKYEDIMSIISLKTYNKVTKFDDPIFTKFLSFLLGESDNIYIMKGVSFTSDCISLLGSKKMTLQNGIKNKMIDKRFWINHDLISFLLSTLNSVKNDSLFENTTYQRFLKYDTISSMMKSMFDEYKGFEGEKELVNSDFILETISFVFNELKVTFSKIKEISEKSKSIQQTNIVVRESLNIIIITYAVLSNIQIND